MRGVPVVESGFFSLNILSASNGDLPSSKAAYISRSKIRSGVTGERFDYRYKKDDLIATGVVLPKGADAKFEDPEILWTDMERGDILSGPRRGKQTAAEYRAMRARIDDPAARILTSELTDYWREDAQLAYDIVFALPFFLTDAQAERASRELVIDPLAAIGMACQFAVHRKHGSKNLHCHVVGATRYIDGDQVTKKKIRGALGSFAGSRTGGFLAEATISPDRFRAALDSWLAANGMDARVAPKRIIPHKHRGPAGNAKEHSSKIANAEARAEGSRLARDPAVLRDYLQESFGTFSREEAEERFRVHWLPKGTSADYLYLKELSSQGLKPPIEPPPVGGSTEPGSCDDFSISCSSREAEFTVEFDEVWNAIVALPDTCPLFDPLTGRDTGRYTVESTREGERRFQDLANSLKAGRPGLDQRSKLLATAQNREENDMAGDRTAALRDAARAGNLALVRHPDGFPRDLIEDLVVMHRSAGYSVQVLGALPGVGLKLRPDWEREERKVRREHAKAAKNKPGAAARKASGSGITPAPSAGLHPSGVTAATLNSALRPLRKGRRKWDSRTCLLLTDTDLAAGVDLEQLVAEAALSGSRVVLLAPDRTRVVPDRRGLFGILEHLLPKAQVAAAGQQTVTRPENRAVVPTITFDAPGDRRIALGVAPSAASGRPNDVNRSSQRRKSRPMPMPRPWRWPGATPGPIFNLSLEADCALLMARLAQLDIEEVQAVYKTLPEIDLGQSKPSPHPLAAVRRQISGRLRFAGLDPKTGGVDLECLAPLQPKNPASWHSNDKLARLPGETDARRLLAPIDEQSATDGRERETTLSRFAPKVLRKVVADLDALFRRVLDEGVRYAISFATLEIYLISKDHGQDLAPEIHRSDLWSIILPADRIYRALRFVDDYPNDQPPQALTIHSPRNSVGLELTESQKNKKPIWLRKPSWAPDGDFGAEPASDRSKHYYGLTEATAEQLQKYQSELLEVFDDAPELRMRAWAAVGIQHVAALLRYRGGRLSPALKDAEAASNSVLRDYRGAKEPIYPVSPFKIARRLDEIETLARAFIDATDRESQTRWAERILRHKTYSDAPREYNYLVSLARTPAGLLFRDGTPDPVALGSTMNQLRRHLRTSVAPQTNTSAVSAPPPARSLGQTSKSAKRHDGGIEL